MLRFEIEVSEAIIDLCRDPLPLNHGQTTGNTARPYCTGCCAAAATAAAHIAGPLHPSRRQPHLVPGNADPVPKAVVPSLHYTVLRVYISGLLAIGFSTDRPTATWL
ncbi:hypothetical protein J6590_040110 [Homalodisca vitripennis]|nr:hypothetical protein J6590_102044 [Homalodisca vitripennis]KAG8311565.1 hypothetical protein J6590_040110 [Homalodisca vitripennis]